MKQELQTIFKDGLKVDDKVIPVEFMKYSGNNEDYIVYHETGEEPIFNCDNETIYSNVSIEFGIYTRGNYLSIVDNIKNVMKKNNYNWTSDDGDLYESDTKYHHYVINFEKIRRI